MYQVSSIFEGAMLLPSEEVKECDEQAATLMRGLMVWQTRLKAKNHQSVAEASPNLPL